MRAASRSLVALVIAAAAGSAVLAHWVIDVIADYLVAHASYDDVAGHGSRELVGALAIVGLAVVASRAFRLCCEAAARSERRAGASWLPGWPHALAFVGTTAVAALAIVPAMEFLDAAGALRGLDDAFGGSIALGAGTTVACAVFVGLAVFAAARWLLAQRARIVAVLAAVIAERSPSPAVRRLEPLDSRVTCRQHRCAHRRGLRAPPCDPVRPTYRNALRGERCYTHSSRRAASLAATSIRPAARRSRTRA